MFGQTSMRYTTLDHACFQLVAADIRATAEEREFLATQASLAEARAPVPLEDYLRAQDLVGGALSLIGTTSICER